VAIKVISRKYKLPTQ